MHRMQLSRIVWSLIVVPAVLLACTGGSSDPTAGDGNTSGGLSSAPPNACADVPVPPHECVGGVPAPRCNPREGGGFRWQIDCVPPDPNAAPDLRGVSSCADDACGPQPSWDSSECVYGFANQASCESIDHGACTWSRRCLPKPCSVEEGTCNTLDRSRLGAPCSAEAPCPEGSSCASITVNIGESVEPVCIEGNPCDALTCAGGRECFFLGSYPAQVVCMFR
jgi:hypothetical protein